MPSTRSGDSVAPVDHLHPLILSAARHDELPEWAGCEPARLDHCRRVAALLMDWAEALSLSEVDRLRWRAAAILHDALRDADPTALNAPGFEEWPRRMRHGPACADRLRADGVDDAELLDAIAFHTVGQPRPVTMGDYLYLADFLEPGRRFMSEERAGMRARVPADAAEVLREVGALRIGQRLENREWLYPETVDFWNRIVEL